jgi:LPS-assembly lipoprotein
MSWSDPPRLLLACLGVAASVLLSACSFSPVFGPSPTGRDVAADLSAITISLPPKPIDDPIPARVGQKVRNDLIFAFTGGNNAAPSRYGLKLDTVVTQTLLGVTRIETAPSYSVHVAVSYELTELTGGRVVARGVATGVAAYDSFNQAFANLRARQDAEDRGASAAADEIRIRLAAALRSGA